MWSYFSASATADLEVAFCVPTTFIATPAPLARRITSSRSPSNAAKFTCVCASKYLKFILVSCLPLRHKAPQEFLHVCVSAFRNFSSGFGLHSVFQKQKFFVKVINCRRFVRIVCIFRRMHFGRNIRVI